jgi:predicted DNA-binding transcriptional regulator YafY
LLLIGHFFYSQKDPIDNGTEYHIELLLHPTYDFMMELLSVGKEVKALNPKSLKEE